MLVYRPLYYCVDKVLKDQSETTEEKGERSSYQHESLVKEEVRLAEYLESRSEKLKKRMDMFDAAQKVMMDYKAKLMEQMEINLSNLQQQKTEDERREAQHVAEVVKLQSSLKEVLFIDGGHHEDLPFSDDHQIFPPKFYVPQSNNFILDVSMMLGNIVQPVDSETLKPKNWSVSFPGVNNSPTPTRKRQQKK